MACIGYLIPNISLVTDTLGVIFGWGRIFRTALAFTIDSHIRNFTNTASNEYLVNSTMRIQIAFVFIQNISFNTLTFVFFIRQNWFRILGAFNVITCSSFGIPMIILITEAFSPIDVRLRIEWTLSTDSINFSMPINTSTFIVIKFFIDATDRFTFASEHHIAWETLTFVIIVFINKF